MSNEAQTVYDLMLERFKQTGERHVEIRVPMELRNKRQDIVSELQFEGLISDADIHGQQNISCTLTDENLCIVSIEY